MVPLLEPTRLSHNWIVENAQYTVGCLISTWSSIGKIERPPSVKEGELRKTIQLKIDANNWSISQCVWRCCCSFVVAVVALNFDLKYNPHDVQLMKN